MFAKLKIGPKIALLLTAIFIGVMIVGGSVLWRVLERKAQDDISNKGLIITDMVNAVRNYTSTHIQPLLADQSDAQTFLAESVPTFSARTVFEQFRQRDEYKDFVYKEATPNPTNRNDRADPDEVALVQQLRQQRDTQELTGFRTLDGQSMFYVARPLILTSATCLHCHSTPDAAPPGMVAQYGAEHGFNWKMNDVVAAQVVYVPAQAVFSAALRSFAIVMGIFIALFAVAILLVNGALKRNIVQPVELLDALAHKVRADEVTPADLAAPDLARLAGRADELGQLAGVFQRMAQEVYARTQNLKQQVQNLHIEIDQMRSQKQVAEIVETDFFRDLQAKAREMRQQQAEQMAKVAAEEEPT